MKFLNNHRTLSSHGRLHLSQSVKCSRLSLTPLYSPQIRTYHQLNFSDLVSVWFRNFKTCEFKKIKKQFEIQFLQMQSSVWQDNVCYCPPFQLHVNHSFVQITVQLSRFYVMLCNFKWGFSVKI